MSLPEPYYDRDGIRIFHGRAEEIAPHMEGVDALVSDVPYGMGWDTDSTRFSGGDRGRPGGADDGRDDYGAIHGDDKPFDPEPWLKYPKVILWGANHYAQRLPVGTWLVWIKRHDHLFGTFLSDCELGWMKGGHGVYAHRQPFSGLERMAELNSDRCQHPTQKPVALMRWAIGRLKLQPGSLVVDPYAGIGTTAVAARDLGFRCALIECEERYCEIAAKRLAQQVLPMEPPKPRMTQAEIQA